MQREGIRPLDMRPSRFTTAPGEPGEERDRVLRLLQHLRSSESLSPQGGSRPAAAAELPPSPDGRAIGGRGASDGARSRGVSGQASRRRGQQQTGTGTKGDGKGLGAKSLASPENRRSPPSGVCVYPWFGRMCAELIFFAVLEATIITVNETVRTCCLDRGSLSLHHE